MAALPWFFGHAGRFVGYRKAIVRMKPFPFPDKENSMEELKQDYVFPKIEPERVDEIFEDAWAVGEEQARRFLEKHDIGISGKRLDMRWGNAAISPSICQGKT